MVFDGYPDGPTIKDQTHNRRYSKSHATVQVSSDAVFVGQRDEFLSNPVNKSRMQKLIGDQATNRGCTVVNMPDDADVGIMTSVIQIAQTETCCVTGRYRSPGTFGVLHGLGFKTHLHQQVRKCARRVADRRLQSYPDRMTARDGVRNSGWT